jgi:hypothetical protein
VVELDAKALEPVAAGNGALGPMQYALSND